MRVSRICRFRGNPAPEADFVCRKNLSSNALAFTCQAINATCWVQRLVWSAAHRTHRTSRSVGYPSKRARSSPLRSRRVKTSARNCLRNPIVVESTVLWERDTFRLTLVDSARPLRGCAPRSPLFSSLRQFFGVCLVEGSHVGSRRQQVLDIRLIGAGSRTREIKDTFPFDQFLSDQIVEFLVRGAVRSCRTTSLSLFDPNSATKVTNLSRPTDRHHYCVAKSLFAAGFGQCPHMLQ